MSLLPFIIVDSATGLIIRQGMSEAPQAQTEAGQTPFALSEFSGTIDPASIAINPGSGSWQPVGGYTGGFPDATAEEIIP